MVSDSDDVVVVANADVDDDNRAATHRSHAEAEAVDNGVMNSTVVYVINGRLKNTMRKPAPVVDGMVNENANDMENKSSYGYMSFITNIVNHEETETTTSYLQHDERWRRHRHLLNLNIHNATQTDNTHDTEYSEHTGAIIFQLQLTKNSRGAPRQRIIPAAERRRFRPESILPWWYHATRFTYQRFQWILRK